MVKKKNNVIYAVNTETKKKIKVYVGNTTRLNPTLKTILKKNIKGLKLPKDFSIDTVNKRVVKQRNAKGLYTNQYKKLLKSNPNSIIPSKEDTFIYNIETKDFVSRKAVLTKKGNLKKQYKGYEIDNGKLIINSSFGFKKKIDMKKNNGLNTWKIYETKKKPNNWNDFVKAIRYQMNKDFTGTEIAKKKRKVLLKFGNLHRWVDWKVLEKLDLEKAEDLFNNWKDNFGSDVETATGNKLIDFNKLDMSYFTVSMLDTFKGGATNAKVDSKYWKTKQPPTKNNCCIEGAINRGLKLDSTYKVLRRKITEYTNGKINVGDMVKLEDISIYETYFNTRINVYLDEPHFTKEAEEEPNCIYKSTMPYPEEVNLLLKDEHYNLITGKKIQISKMTNKEREFYGLSTKKKTKTVTKKEKGNKLKEVLVVFDIETVFDKNDHNYLKSYGVSWFCWDKDEDFDYDLGWNEDKTKNFFNEEPFCFYRKGEGCLEPFIEFLMNPPEGVIYKPLGFNNSRFDNFAVCEEANRLGLLGNVFFADGSILYMKLLGCKNSWDASRFLTGKSLDSSCKDYNTNPKKRKDLIDHYEIQCYFEANGWDGLCKLLEDREELVLYNKIDCICLLDLTLKMRQSYLDMFNTDILENFTLSSMGFKILQKTWKENDLKIVEPQSYKADKFFRDSLTAGRTQSFYGKYDYKMKVAMGDIKSLYPTVLGNYGENYCPFPYGRYKHTNKEMCGKMGIYRCNIKHQKCIWKNKSKVKQNMGIILKEHGIDLFRDYAPNVIAKREKDKPLDWFWKDEIIDVKLTSVDIDVLRWATEDINCVEVFDGYYWEEERTDLFFPFLNPPKEEKSKQDELKAHRKQMIRDNPKFDELNIQLEMIKKYGEDYNEAKREGSKGVSNSMSGKLLEALHTDVCEKFSPKKFIDFEKDEGIKEMDLIDFGNGFCMISGKKAEEDVFVDMKHKKPSYLGMFCYSYARKLMYQKILSKYITLYMDTDSACMPLMEWDRLVNDNIDKNFVDTGEYGCIEEEVCDMIYCDKCLKIKDTPEYRRKKQKDGKRCKDCKFICADRVIAIAPKNYMVENTEKQEFSKRKFKGVRKNDFWLPLDHFGEVCYDITDKGFVLSEKEGTAKYNIKQLDQDQIRRIREFKCCKKCITDKMNAVEHKCKECEGVENIMKKTYTTEMFEYLAKGNKIAIFCSMINRIKFKLGEVIDWEFEKVSNGTPTFDDLCKILEGFKTDGTQKNPIQLKFNVDNKEFDTYHTELNKIHTEAKKIDCKKARNKLVADWCKVNRKFENEVSTRNLTDTFKLKQQYLVKIV
tara:strand:- start:1005 stop:4931 length:3927 start_codon:yes stop_codon:yes gene_type:complete